MTRQRRAFRLLPTRRGDPRASVAAFIVQSILLFIVVPSFVVPVALDFLRDDAGRPVTPERISFITAAPRGGPATTEAPRAGGDGRDAAPGPVEPLAPVAAPTEVPTGLPSAPAEGARRPSGGVGPLVGGGGPTAGVRPSFNDPRLWAAPSEEVLAPRLPMTRADSLNALLRATAEAYVDSLQRATPMGGRAPGDWTFQRGGKTYGIDQRYIRLGDFSIPTAVLALLPMNNVQGNPTAMDRARRLSSMRSEIIEQAERRQRDDDFVAAVRALRARKEKERKEAQEAAQRSAGNEGTTIPPA